MPRKPRVDSLSGAKETMNAALSEVNPPDHIILRDDAIPFWRSITQARSAGKWNETDLEVAAELARNKAHIERLNTELEAEGDVIVNDRGTPIVNPKHSLLETLTRRMIALSRMLQVHAEATQGKSRDQVKGNKATTGARKAVKTGDDLIARPH